MGPPRGPAARAAAGGGGGDGRVGVGAGPPAGRAPPVPGRAPRGDDAAGRGVGAACPGVHRTVRSDDGAFAGAALAYTDVTDFMRALQVKDEFVALVSHELRTPLTSIVGYVQLLEEDRAMPPHAVEQLRVVHRNAERLRRLI